MHGVATSALELNLGSPELAGYACQRDDSTGSLHPQWAGMRLVSRMFGDDERSLKNGETEVVQQPLKLLSNTLVLNDLRRICVL